MARFPAPLRTRWRCALLTGENRTMPYWTIRDETGSSSGALNGLSGVRGNSHAPFLGSGDAAMRCCYPTKRYLERAVRRSRFKSAVHRKRFKVYDIQLQIREQAGKCTSLQLGEPPEASGGPVFPGRSQTLNLLQHNAVVVGF